MTHPVLLHRAQSRRAQAHDGADRGRHGARRLRVRDGADARGGARADAGRDRPGRQRRRHPPRRADRSAERRRPRAGGDRREPARHRDRRATARKLVSKEPVVLINLPKRDIGQAVERRHPRRHAGRPRAAAAGAASSRGGCSGPARPRSSPAARSPTASRAPALGETLRFASRDWTVVGVFDAGRTGFDSEIWGDAEQMLQAFRRVGFSSLHLQARRRRPLRRGEARDRERSAAARSKPSARRASTPTSRRRCRSSSRYLGTTISVIFSIGAIIGAMITMYASVASRTGEIGTLRALGFSRAVDPGRVPASRRCCSGCVGGVVGLVARVVHAGARRSRRRTSRRSPSSRSRSR